MEGYDAVCGNAEEYLEHCVSEGECGCGIQQYVYGKEDSQQHYVEQHQFGQFYSAWDERLVVIALKAGFGNCELEDCRADICHCGKGRRVETHHSVGKEVYAQAKDKGDKHVCRPVHCRGEKDYELRENGNIQHSPNIYVLAYQYLAHNHDCSKCNIFEDVVHYFFMPFISLSSSSLLLFFTTITWLMLLKSCRSLMLRLRCTPFTSFEPVTIPIGMSGG